MTAARRHGLTVLALAALLLAAACGGSDASTDGGAGAPAATDGAITVAAASDLRLAFEELGEAFTADTGTEVTFTFGSSGQLREQIVNGAPFDLFASANVEFVDAVIEAGFGDPDTKADYAYGRIALRAAPGASLPARIEDLADPAYARIAIANPEHAPYGAAARQALERSGVLADVEPRLVLGENISDALRITDSGNADVGIVALSLVIAGADPYTLVDEALHEPLRQALVVVGDGPEADDAAELASFVASPAGREVMVRYGFVLPGEGPPS
jgi:molybdate transport system substrate-binding protein